ncbi:hypothetical protein [Bacillus cereus]|uniref:hypothetical protein n=1 Tax=Bacillus cereus group TaxID=86661 RepID=UPI0001A1C972|nr:hypothetical protein bthur0010_60050 [Bacillus thuringiensis serovar pondicheriensis BGSC 4BA1]
MLSPSINQSGPTVVGVYANDTNVGNPTFASGQPITIGGNVSGTNAANANARFSFFRIDCP